MHFKLQAALEAQARKAPLFLVGGSVRDALMQRACHDWDLVCRGARERARTLRRSLGGTLVVLDEVHRIYRLVLPGEPVPTTLDIAELYGGTIEKDLARRDFTINAMARRIGESNIIDPFGGQRDLRRRLIKAVSAHALTEDPLRLLRAFRFAAQLGFRIEPRTARWIKRQAPLLNSHPKSRGTGVARERVREEFLKLLAEPRAGAVLRAMDQAGVLRAIIPEVEACRRTAHAFYGRGGVLSHCFNTVENLEWLLSHYERHAVFASPEVCSGVRRYLAQAAGGFPQAAWLKWAAFLHDIGKPATARRLGGRLRFFGHEDVGARQALGLMADLRFSRAEALQTSAWVRHHMRLGNLAAAQRLTDKAIARYFRDLGDHGIGMLLISLADHYDYLVRRRWGKATDPVEKACRRMLMSLFHRAAIVRPTRLVDGHQLMRALKLKPGPLIGRLLEAIQDAQAEGKVCTAKEAVAFGAQQRKRLERASG